MAMLAIAEFFVKAEKAGEFMELLRDGLPETRSYDGCESVETWVDQDDPGHVYLLEKWGARSEHEAYLAWRIEGGLMERLEPFNTAPPKFTYLDARPDI